MNGLQPTETVTYMVRCKCPGQLGTARLTLNPSQNPDGYEAALAIWSFRWAATACWACRRHFVFTQLRGRFSREHRCGARCLASKGPSCECACAGRNHGANYA